jgi:hypothetical protein
MINLSKSALTRLLVSGAILCATWMQAGTARAQQAPAANEQSEVTAIDVFREPDATMLQHSADNNARC